MLTSDSRRSHAFTDLHTTRSEHWEFRHAAITHVGRHRTTNEDYFTLHPDRHLYVIADGMGGHAAGDVASRIAGETVAAYFDEVGMPRRPDPTSDGDESLPHHLVQAAKIANSSIFEEADESPERQGMGTTLVSLAFCDDLAAWAHVGDSRLFRYRNEQLQQLTRDHSLLNQTIDRHDITGDEQQRLQEQFPYKNVLTRALGSSYVVDVDADSAPLEDGDLFVMTTDGVHDVIGNDAVKRLVEEHADDWAATCQAIVSECNQAGGPDNITVACIEARRLRPEDDET